MTSEVRFKKGDRVVCIAADLAAVHRGNTYTVAAQGAAPSRFCLEETKLYHNLDTYFMHERDYVEMCIEALRERGIGVSRTTLPDNRYVWYADGAPAVSVPALLNKLYPIKPEETAEQKELRELEEAQRKIAERMKQLREKIK